MLFVPRPRTTGELIRHAREQRSLTVPDLAKRLGVSNQTLYRWEWDAVSVSDAKLQAVALALHVPIGSLRGGSA